MEPNNNDKNTDDKASMAEQQQSPRTFPQLVQPTQPPFPWNNSPPVIYNSLLTTGGGDALTRESPSSWLVSNGTDDASTFAFRLQVEVLKLEMELRKKNMENAEKDTTIKYLEEAVRGLLQLTPSPAPVSTIASIQDQLGQLTIGSRKNTLDHANNNRRGRSLERVASPSNTLNLNAHLNFTLEELQSSKFLRLAISKDNYEALKKRIEHGNNVEEINFVYEELKGYIPKLCHNSYGSQVIVELLNLGHHEKIRQVFELVLPELVNLCYDPNGTAVIQKLVEAVAEPEQIFKLFRALMNPLLRLSLNGNACKVIARCIETFPSKWDKYFMNTVLRNCMDLATDKHGCCVLQKCVQHAGTATARHRLMEEILRDVLHLSKHFYGNYVVQCVVLDQNNIFHYADLTTERLKGNFVALSMHKFSSNVVEKILNNASIEKVRDVINEIVEDPNVLAVFQDQYGNYVIQKALTATVNWPNNIFDAIAKVIENNHSTLDCHMYGKRVINCLMKLKNERRPSYHLASLEEPSYL